jgi:hypothetical protein
MRLNSYMKGRGYQDRLGCVLAGVAVLAILLTALGYLIGSHI